MTRRPPRSPLFPSTPLFRSRLQRLVDVAHGAPDVYVGARIGHDHAGVVPAPGARQHPVLGPGRGVARADPQHTTRDQRSEEHTSELQSLAYIVCRLLLEKKK